MAVNIKQGIFVIGAKRTPFCKHGGSLRELPACHAYAAAAKAAIQTAKVNPALIDNTVVGNTFFLSQCDGGKTPRYCGIYSDVPLERPALGVNKACGTGIQAVITSAVDILTGPTNISLTGGTELMSALPLLVRNTRFGTTLGTPLKMEDHIKREFPDSYTGVSLERMAEEVAKKHGVVRRNVDEFVLQSHLKFRKAQLLGAFADELVSLTVKNKKKDVVLEKDELLHPGITADELDKEAPLLEGGEVITRGNTAAPADGASAILLSSEAAVTQHSLTPLARVSGWACVGVSPEGLGAVEAIRKLLEGQGRKVGDVDLYEINENLPSNVLVSSLQLSLNPDTLNVSGGAAALGHPVAATGARMVTSLVWELRRRNVSRGIVASSCGGGQGVAVMLERV